MRKIITVLLCSSLMLFLSSCSFGNFSVDTLLTAPKLSVEQQGIHEGLIEAVGNNIKMKYPRSGSNRSSYVVVNLDDEPSEEAIAFFEYNTSVQFNATASEDIGVRFCVLDKNEDDKWIVVDEQAVAGTTDIDRIIVTQLDDSGKVSIIAGYLTLNINDKVMYIYTYSDGKLETVAEESYSLLETLDINNDGYSEVITVQSGGDGYPATASLLSLSDGEIIKNSVISMSERFQSIASYKKGKATINNKALFIDCRYGDGLLSTEFIYYRYDALQNPVAQISPEQLADLTVRPEGYYCTDVDDDGIIEIPTVDLMKGYELLQTEEQLYLTTWSEYSDFYELVPKYVGYYSISNGYMMCFPDNWIDNVTVKRDEFTGEIVFYVYKDSLDASDTEIMRIAISSRADTEQYLLGGYQKITSAGQLDYLVKISDNVDSSIKLDLNGVIRNFYVVS